MNTGKLESVEIDKISEKFDVESACRRLKGKIGLVVALIAIAMSMFHFYTAGFGIFEAMKQRAIHVSFMFAVGFLLWPAFKKLRRDVLPWYDILLAMLGVGVGSYILFNYQSLVLRAGMPTQLDFCMGILAILLVLELSRRLIGPELPIIAALFLLYARYGQWLPSPLNHRGVTWSRLVEHTYLTTEGIFGTPIMVSSTFVFLFILYGAFLEKTGVGKFFIDMAFAVTGRMRGGPAKAAVLASGMMGSISGSSVANTVTTGALTIPAMKRAGYKPEFAGAVEAAASTGGQIMPPVMGAAAFIMSEMTGIPYFQIVLAAAIPAVLYYVGVGAMVHLEAVKTGIKGLPASELPGARATLQKGWHLIIPLVAIVFFLMRGNSPFKAAYWSIWLAIAASMLKKETRISLKDFFKAMEEGARRAVGVAAACACAGIVVGVVTLTGLGLRFASMIIAVSQGNLIITLVLTMFASIILGMGLPTTAKYIVLATMAAPALVQLDVPLIAAHLFILYFGVVADITPPVALAAYAGAGIAGANSMKTGFIALKLALAGFLIPYIFALSPALVLVDVTWIQAAHATFTATVGIIALASGVQSHFVIKTRVYEQILLFVSAFSLIVPGLRTDTLGFSALVAVFLLQKIRKPCLIRG